MSYEIDPKNWTWYLDERPIVDDPDDDELDDFDDEEEEDPESEDEDDV